MSNTSTPTIRSDKAIELSDDILEHLGVRPGDTVEVETAEPGTVVIRRAIVPLPLDEFFARYRFDQPVDWKALQEGIGEDIARDALRSLRG